MMKTSILISNLLNIRLLFFALISLILFSCKSGETIADKGIIQKRKYQKGYHVNIKSPFDSNNNSVHIEKTSEETFTASLRASLPSKSIEPVLAKPVAKESKLKAESIDVKRPKKTKADNTLANEYVKEASASLDKSVLLKSEKNFYSNKNQIQNQPQDYYSARRLSTVSLLSFIFGVLSLFILGIPFGIAAVVLGIIGIVQVEKNRDIYKGQGFAIAGLIIGLISVVILLAVLSAAA
ncbi:DUF4190 domain-containing protein [Cryomorpha ignava]|uniref:DUF4190 domain-containing protein n=1 Tax=Cryomorpha ignava TaxID=101383 RepID=A0A7K3WR70_9FLAO|nr:DUF4190 domain-containing protein [Cryomorpha ignava]NEN24179.1 DUF4190 domain-containing protein [Cryomorpha ignava]